MQYVEAVIYAPFPGIRLPVLDVVGLIVLFVARASPGGKTGRARPVDVAMLVSAGTLIGWAIFGIVRGGSALDMRLQLHSFVVLIAFGFMYEAAMKTSRDFFMLGKTIVAAAVFRSCIILIFYWF